MPNALQNNPANKCTVFTTELKVFGAIAVALLMACQLIQNRIVSAIALLGAAWTGWMFFMGSSGVIASRLKGFSKTVFQIVVAVGFPSIASLYFLIHVTSTADILGRITPYVLLPVAIIGYLSWVGADQLNKEVPVTGFLVAATALFVLCFIFHNGAVTDNNDFDETSSVFTDKNLAKSHRQSGEYFGLYLLYVATSYTSMLLKIRREEMERRLIAFRAKHLG